MVPAVFIVKQPTPTVILCWHPAGFLLFYSAMKNLRYSFLTLAIVVATVFSAAAQSKIATVDLDKIFNGYYKTKLAQSALKSRETELTKEIREMATGLEKLQADYKQLTEQANNQAISPEEREKLKQTMADKAKEIATSNTAIEQFQRQAKAQLEDQTQRMRGNLLTEIQKAVGDKAKAGGFALVMNSGATQVVVFASNESDITASVIAQLNAGAPIDVTTPATTGVPLNISTNLP